jgi:hypothetical protein
LRRLGTVLTLLDVGAELMMWDFDQAFARTTKLQACCWQA